MNEPTPFFDEANNGTVFLAVQIWRNEDTKLIEQCSGAWEWEQVAAVIGPVSPAQWEDVDGETCSLLFMGKHLHVRADQATVLRAWLRYKSRFGGQYIRLIAN
jgi:hypothetical protein